MHCVVNRGLRFWSLAAAAAAAFAWRGAAGDPAIVSDSKPEAQGSGATAKPSLAPVGVNRPITPLELFQRSLQGGGNVSTPTGEPTFLPATPGPTPLDAKARKKLNEQNDRRKNFLLNSGNNDPANPWGDQQFQSATQGKDINKPKSALERNLRQDLTGERESGDAENGDERGRDKKDEREEADPKSEDELRKAKAQGGLTGPMKLELNAPSRISVGGAFDRNRGEVQDAFKSVLTPEERALLHPSAESSPDTFERARSATFSQLLDGSYRGGGLDSHATGTGLSSFDAILGGPSALGSPAFANPFEAGRSSAGGLPVAKGFDALKPTGPADTSFLPRPINPAPFQPSAPAFQAQPGVLPLPSRGGP